MTGETLRAVLMIAMFGMLEAVLYLAQGTRLRRWLDDIIDRLWHALPLPHPRPRLVPIRNKRRKG